MQVILAVDVGSSSVRCSAYRVVDDDSSTASVQALDGCSAQSKLRSVEPNSGKIILMGTHDSSKQEGESRDYSLLEEIDACIDTTLIALRERYPPASLQVIGLGFSTFVMNLVAMDKNGVIVGSEATLSYACNTPQVANECRSLRRFVVTVCSSHRLALYVDSLVAMKILTVS